MDVRITDERLVELVTLDIAGDYSSEAKRLAREVQHYRTLSRDGKWRSNKESLEYCTNCGQSFDASRRFLITGEMP